MNDTQRPVERTPRGTAKFLSLNAPDTKYKAEGEYRLILVLEGADAESLQKRIDDAINIAVLEAKSNKTNLKYIKNIKASDDKPYKDDTDKEGNPTGKTRFSFKAKASGKRKDGTVWEFRPMVFDNLGQPIDLTKVNIWGGSEVKVAFEMRPYGIKEYSPKMGVGVSLNMSAVQVLKLRTGSGKDAAAFGFAVEEGDADLAGSPAPVDPTSAEF